jgi:hypothetical protein
MAKMALRHAVATGDTTMLGIINVLAHFVSSSRMADSPAAHELWCALLVLAFAPAHAPKSHSAMQRARHADCVHTILDKPYTYDHAAVVHAGNAVFEVDILACMDMWFGDVMAYIRAASSKTPEEYAQWLATESPAAKNGSRDSAVCTADAIMAASARIASLRDPEKTVHTKRTGGPDADDADPAPATKRARLLSDPVLDVADVPESLPVPPE